MSEGWGGARPGAGHPRKTIHQHRRDHTRPHYDPSAPAPEQNEEDGEAVFRDPPTEFSPDAADLWFDLAATFELFEPADDLAYERLMIACEAWSRYEQARRLIEDEGLIVRDRFGQPRLHPAVTVERSCRAAYLRALRDLEG